MTRERDNELLEKIGRVLRAAISKPPLVRLREEFERERRQSASSEESGTLPWWRVPWWELLKVPILSVQPTLAASGSSTFWRSTEVFLAPGERDLEDAKRSLLILCEPWTETDASGETRLAFMARLPETAHDGAGTSDLRPVDPARYELVAIEGDDALSQPWTISSEQEFAMRIVLRRDRADRVDPLDPTSWPFRFILRRA